MMGQIIAILLFYMMVTLLSSLKTGTAFTYFPMMGHIETLVKCPHRSIVTHMDLLD